MVRIVLSTCALAALVWTPLFADQPLVAPTSDGYVLQGPAARAGLPHPERFLAYRLGSRYTPHHRVVDYLEALAEASDRVRLSEYGRTVEDRPLHLVMISSPGNLARLDQIFETSRRLGTEPGPSLEDQPALVWLAYGVHGNETSAAEAALAVAWQLAAGPLEDLEDVVVLLDPLVNPDGRARYVQWFREVSGREPDSHVDAVEHREPWPGGRFNHYLFDLNRDWTWLTQRETRQRLAIYRRVEPQVYVDVHEMSASSTYYFPPPARPVLPLLRGSMDDFELFGRGNADAFDERGWTYFVREVYDFFYPGYGDTYPTLRGSLGMTYEMAGGGGAGKLLERRDGTRLSLADRVARHAVATLETVRTAARNRERLVRRAAQRRAEGLSLPVRTYLWRADQPEARALADLLVRHGLSVRRLEGQEELRVQPVWPGDEVLRTFRAGTFAASTDQVDASVLRALLEPHHDLASDFLERQKRRLEAGEGEEIFDVTAWSLPLAYGVEAWIHDGRVAGSLLRGGALDTTVLDPVVASPIGWRVAPQGLAGHKFAAGLFREGVRTRIATAPTRGDLYGSGYRPDGKGTLLVPREGNDAAVIDILTRLSTDTGVVVESLTAGLLADERNAGSGAYRRVVPPTVGLVAGRGVSPTSHGALWHLFDQVVQMPVRRLDVDRLANAALDELDVLVLPDGRWGRVSERARKALDRWLRDGGVLVAIAGAHDLAKEADWTEIEPRVVAEASDDSEPPARATDPSVPGAFVGGQMQIRHRLALGSTQEVAVLMRGSRFLEPSGDPQVDLLVVRTDEPRLSGLLWPEAESLVAGSLLVGTEGVGDGLLVTFAQDPGFRGFVRSTMDLLLDVVFYGPSV
ncbi:MAG: hypothetical protein MPN21_11565 [Thermoanaerobaculia bacterium]|nr:hypothetical protein [Thermoanaerobaculia bacterium]